MDKFTCRLTQYKDTEQLTKISIKSFHSDYEVGAPQKTGGPPGYDSHNFHRRMLKISKAFYTILDGARIIGGFFIFQKSRTLMQLARIFIDPEYIRKGIGTRALNYLFKKFPNIKKWTLDTPKWNVRTKNFYTKLDFYIEREDNNFYYFSKHF